jgi:hypothetical protein
MGLLSREEYVATFGATRSRVDAHDPAPFNFWLYFDMIPEADFEGHDCSAGHVQYVWREPVRYEHVLVNSEDRNVFMVLVLDRMEFRVLGHRLVDLKREYGLKS